jgi:hypothetical protein
MRREGWALAALATLGTPLGAQAARLQLDVTADTSLPAGGRWPLRVTTAAPSQVTVMLAPLLPDTPPIHLESERVDVARTFWPLRGPADGPVLTGAYRLIVTAEPDSGPPVRSIRVLVVERETPDTQPHPPALDKMSLLPESTRTVSRRPGFLIITGIGLATLAATVTLSEDPAGSPVTIAVPGALALGGLLGFVKGRSSVRALPGNVAHNNELVDADAAARRRIADANARLLAAAPLRVRVVDAP